MRDTSSSLKTDLDRYETNQLKMSAALSSKEVFRKAIKSSDQITDIEDIND